MKTAVWRCWAFSHPNVMASSHQIASCHDLLGHLLCFYLYHWLFCCISNCFLLLLCITSTNVLLSTNSSARSMADVFFRPDNYPLIPPAVSKQWREIEALTPFWKKNIHWPRHVLLHVRTPEGNDIAILSWLCIEVSITIYCRIPNWKTDICITVSVILESWVTFAVCCSSLTVWLLCERKFKKLPAVELYPEIPCTAITHVGHSCSDVYLMCIQKPTYRHSLKT